MKHNHYCYYKNYNFIIKIIQWIIITYQTLKTSILLYKV